MAEILWNNDIIQDLWENKRYLFESGSHDILPKVIGDCKHFINDPSQTESEGVKEMDDIMWKEMLFWRSRKTTGSDFLFDCVLWCLCTPSGSNRKIACQLWIEQEKFL